MDKLLSFLNSLTPAEQDAFARRCRTTVGYLRKAISVKQLLREALCIDIERESGRRVLCEDLRADVDWRYLRTSGDVTRAPIAPATPDLFPHAQPAAGSA